MSELQPIFANRFDKFEDTFWYFATFKNTRELFINMNNSIYAIFIWSVIFVSVSRGGDSIYERIHKRQVSEKGERMSMDLTIIKQSI